MYRSEVKHDPNGIICADGAGCQLPCLASSVLLKLFLPTVQELCRSPLKLSLQSGIAPDWLVYGSVEWTDWSVLQTLNYQYWTPSRRTDPYYWKDGWTVQGGRRS